MKEIVIVFNLFFFICPQLIVAQYNVRKFGAKGDGVSLDTRFIQQAIDEAFKNKGGIIEVPPGTYKIGTLILKDNINLNLQAGALLLGSPDYKDYTAITQQFESRTKDLYAKYFMVFAEGANNISITGQGIIDGNGLKNFQAVRPQNLRPFLMRLVNCDNIIVRDVHLLESANWTFHLLGCKDVNIDGIVIENSGRGNRDGLDIDACQRVTVSNSRFFTTDDAIVLKSTSDILCQDITITNCVIRTKGSAVKTGTESNGGFKNITVSNCVFKDVPNHAGIELMTVDGGILQNVLLENITMENVNTPIFIRLGIRARPYKEGQYVDEIGEVKDISLNNISVMNAKLPSSIMGLHSKKIKNVLINNYTVRNSSSQIPIPYNKVPLEEFSYPMAIMFKNLPAYGLYCRNVEELHLQNISMYAPDNESRPAFSFDRVNNLELFSIKAEIKVLTTPMIHLRNARNIVAGFCKSLNMNNALFEIEESTVSDLHLTNNILHAGQKELAKVDALPDDEIFEDFKTASKYPVDQGDTIRGLMAHDLGSTPLKVNITILNKSSLQLRLLMLNNSTIPQKVIVKYGRITQHFLITWNEWGWAPVTLLKEYDKGQLVDFEIMMDGQSSDLRIAKIYLAYPDIANTD